MNHDEENDLLFRALMAHAPDQVCRVLSTPNCDIDPEFLGFVDFYAHLSALIPRHWTVIDLGCAYAPQAWYFRNHREYLGIDGFTPLPARFAFPNSRHLEQRIETFLDDYEAGRIAARKPVFAVMNYVPVNSVTKERVRATFPHLFVYYPQRDPEDSDFEFRSRP